MECPHCHFKNQSGNKFCIKCGTKLPLKNASVSEAEAFVGFFKQALLHPIAMKLPTQPKFGYVSLLIYLVMASLTVASFGKKITYVFENFKSAFGTTATMSPLIGQFIIGISIFVLVILISDWLLGWAAINVMMNHRVKLGAYTIQYGRFLNVGSCLFLLSIILTFICPLNVMYIGLATFSIACVVSTFALADVILTADNQGSLDSFYILILVYVLVLIIGLFTIRAVVGHIISNLTNLAQFIQG
ncbi:zinc ribbon domain-containing protein [Fructilactobacillus hinvesii]|uniref:Zinc ribbon domain-containing protein n=1 Tax=Fructilactobacillus hinvesii TaxID=2940300 RepID=A0ABY5BTE2_9LACO|nr:zinc ribbon domain-containing protein [Fructilactobacillus hinvesii]USS88109.1 zinc ribbon domain-containing protein [Fructilactobacillus hinvesii]